MVMRVLPFAGISAPRLPFEKSYSALIVSHLVSCSAACGNETDFLTAKRIDNNQNYPCATGADGNKPLLIFRVRVEPMDCQRIEEYAFCISEGDTVFL